MLENHFTLRLKMKSMEQTDKHFYEAPSIMMFEVKQEGVICFSDPITGGNSINGWEDGGTTDDEVYM